MENILKLINSLLPLVEAGSAAYNRIMEVQAELTKMQAEGRDPNQAEWDALFARIDASAAALDAADKRLNPGQ